MKKYILYQIKKLLNSKKYDKKLRTLILQLISLNNKLIKNKSELLKNIKKHKTLKSVNTLINQHYLVNIMTGKISALIEYELVTLEEDINPIHNELLNLSNELKMIVKNAKFTDHNKVKIRMFIQSIENNFRIYKSNLDLFNDQLVSDLYNMRKERVDLSMKRLKFKKMSDNITKPQPYDKTKIKQFKEQLEKEFKNLYTTVLNLIGEKTNSIVKNLEDYIDNFNLLQKYVYERFIIAEEAILYGMTLHKKEIDDLELYEVMVNNLEKKIPIKPSEISILSKTNNTERIIGEFIPLHERAKLILNKKVKRMVKTALKAITSSGKV